MLTALLILLAQEPVYRPTVYDPDPEHVWNRLHRAFHRRDGELDPLLGALDKDFLEGDRYRNTMAVLDEFLAKDGAALLKDPVRRLLLQRDLWAVFDLAAWTADDWVHLKKHEADAVALRERLAKAIARLALAPEEFAALPDAFALATKSGEFPPDVLPPDLFDPKGPWVRVSDFPPVAPHHTKAAGGRSHFHLILNLPGGREATLRRLTTIDPEDAGVVPPGTRAALVRRTLGIDRDGRIRPTPLIESIQVRVLREPVVNLELVLDRRKLLEGKAGGLRAVGPEEIDPDPLFRVFGFGPRREQIPTVPVMKLCGGCHGAAVIGLAGAARITRTRSLGPVEPDVELGYTPAWKAGQYSWGLLQGWLESLPKQPR